MFSFKAAYFYFLAVKILLVRFVKNIYFSTNYYNKSLKTKLPEQLYFYPNPFLLSSFINQKTFTFKLSKINIDTFWRDFDSLKEEEDLNSFFWLNLINRKNNGETIQQIISIWIKNNNKYKKKNWGNLSISKRILAWILNADIILNNADKIFKENFFNSIITQVNHLKENLNDENDPAKKIEIISAIILSGLVFKEYNSNFERGIKALKNVVESFFDNDGCPINRNIYDLVQCSKFLILIKECCKDAQEYIPDFLDDIITKLVNCLFSLKTPNNKNPLFNGASEFEIDNYLEYLSGLNYKSNKIIDNINQIYIARSKKYLFFFDVGSPPIKKYSKNYQSGPLSFEYFIDNNKIITNCGFGNKISKKTELISRLTSAQSTLGLNDSSVVRFERNNLINDAFGTSITNSFKVFDLNIDDKKDYLALAAKHNAYENNFNYIHQRKIKINKKNSNLSGEDKLIATSKNKEIKNMYSIRFHLYPGINAVQTMGKNSILIQVEKNKSLIFTTSGDNLILEKSIFLGRNQIINNFCITIFGSLNNNQNKDITWELKRNN
ncbi:heparinase II/III family protein [Pelagibacteraceae bacterium]|nr:heparinase II/III family protein [Pelagibacteraceae bacterium]